MTGFGIQKKGTSPILAKRKKFKEGGYSLIDEVSEPKMERMPYNEDEDYVPKMERMPYYGDKDYKPKLAKKKKK